MTWLDVFWSWGAISVCAALIFGNAIRWGGGE